MDHAPSHHFGDGGLNCAIFFESLKVVVRFRFVAVRKIVWHKNTFTLKQKQQDEKKVNYKLLQICGLNVKEQQLQPLN